MPVCWTWSTCRRHPCAPQIPRLERTAACTLLPMNVRAVRRVDATQPRPHRVIVRLAMVCTVLAGLVLSAQFVRSGIQSVGLVWPVTHPEGATIAAVLRVRDGEPVYQNFLQYPHVITPYPPMQPVVAGLTARLLGL